jgi:hypothetical protein
MKIYRAPGILCEFQIIFLLKSDGPSLWHGGPSPRDRLMGFMDRH